MSIAKLNSGFLFLLIIIFLSASVATAQTTVFTYQGKLTDSGNLANAAYDMQFKLFDAATNGTQIGATLTFDGNSGNPPSVSVTNGIFTVSLDFGSATLSGADRYLEIGLKPAGNPGGYQQLLPRQKLTSTPYAVRSLNAGVADVLSSACVGCVTSTQVGSVSGAAVNGQIPLASVPAGSPSYVQNTTSQQSASNFNISGNGTAGGTLSSNVVNAMSQYNIAGQRVLSMPGSFNLFVGLKAGQQTISDNNSFFGFQAGQLNNSGDHNAFFGSFAGNSNTSGHDNAFFGASTGISNTIGIQNAFFGSFSGNGNTTGNNNAFFGFATGTLSSTGSDNAFFGTSAGFSNTTGFNNAFFGSFSGSANTIGNNNAFFGFHAGDSNANGTQNTFIGSRAGDSTIDGGNNSFIGFIAGRDNTSGNNNAFFGSGSGASNTTGFNNAFFGMDTGISNTTGNHNTVIGSGADIGSGNLDHATAIGADSVASLSDSIYLGRPNGSDAVRIPGPTVINGSLVVGTLGSAGSTSICLNVANRISPCSSSLRYKTNVQTFTGGLDVVRRLRPITFTWKDGGMRDVGFAAEDVQAIAPLLATYNKEGQIEGVKYGQLTTVLVNAVKEQQTQIEAQRQQLRFSELEATLLQQQFQKQQQELAVLKQWYCRTHTKSALCQTEQHIRR